MKLTFNELFGFDGMIPLDMYSGVGGAVCPYCEKNIRQINFPPPGVIIIHHCPSCGGLVIPFLKKMVAVDKDKLSGEENIARLHLTDCLFSTISPILMDFADRVLTGDLVLKDFFDRCWQLVYQLVGEKEDSESFLNKIKKNGDNRGHQLAKEYVEYFERMSEMFQKIGSPVAKKQSKFEVGRPKRDEVISVDEIIDLNTSLKKCESVDDFLLKFSDSLK